MSDVQGPIVVVIGAGEMGAAVARRMLLGGARVRVSLEGRSAASTERIRRAEVQVVHDDAALVHDADFILSIVPPAAAIAVAERWREALATAAKRPIFADCNAVSPATAIRIGQVLARCECRYVDAGIIGGPPPEDRATPGPRFYASGPHARDFAMLARFGLEVAVLDGPIGAASALKLSYAGLTKGLIALGATMVASAARAGLADALASELARTQPQILKRLAQQIPAMFPKANRWVAEMNEIADFVGSDEHGALIYRGAARLYEDLARAQSEDAKDLRALSDFCRTVKASSGSN